MDHQILARRPNLIIINKKKRTCKIVYFAVPADHRIKLKECEKKDKYLDLAWELKQLWNIKVTIIPIVIDAFGNVTKGLLKGLENLKVGGRVGTSKQKHYWEWPEYKEKCWRLEEICSHSNSGEKPSAKTDEKLSRNNNNDNNNNNPLVFWHLHPSIYRILIVYCVAVSEQYVVELSGLPYFRGNFVQPCSFFQFLIFLRTESSSSCVNGPSLMDEGMHTPLP